MSGRQYTAQSTLSTFTSNNHTLSVTVPSGLTNSIMVITKSCNVQLPWTTYSGITVNGSSSGIVDAGDSGSALANRSLRAWYVLSPTPGTYNVQVQFSTSSSNGGMLTVTVYDGVDQTIPIADFDKNSFGSGASPITTPSLTVPSNAWTVSQARALSATSVTPGGSATTIGTANADEAAFELQNATTMSMGWSGVGSTQASIVAVVLNPAAGGAFTLTADQGSYSITGQTAGVLANRVVTADQGTYSLTGQDATLVKETPGAFSLTADFGTYTLAGQDASFVYVIPGTYVLSAASGSYNILGSDALGDYVLSAEFGTYSLSGQDVSFVRTYPAAYTLSCETGNYSLEGSSARLIWSGAPVVVNIGSQHLAISLMRIGL